MSVSPAGSGSCFFMASALFSYNATEFSLGGKKFGNHIALHEGCCFDEITNTLYELVNVEYTPLTDSINMESFLSTLANQMTYWRNFKSASTIAELHTLVNETLIYCGENMARLFEADDFDEYVLLLLEAQDLLERQMVSEKHLEYFVVYEDDDEI